MSELLPAGDVLAVMTRLKARRGFVFPHRGVMALTAPELLDAYDATYEALTIEPRVLDERSREFIWIGILVTMRESIATHHIDRLRGAGGTDADFETATRLAGFGVSAGAFRFVESSWSSELAGFDREEAYRSALRALVADSTVETGLVEMTMAAVHACLGNHWELGLHIRRAYEANVDEAALAEALSLTMFRQVFPVSSKLAMSGVNSSRTSGSRLPIRFVPGQMPRRNSKEAMVPSALCLFRRRGELEQTYVEPQHR